MPVGFLVTFVPRIIEGITKAGRPEPEVSPKKIMTKLDELQRQMDDLSMKLGVEPDRRWD